MGKVLYFKVKPTYFGCPLCLTKLGRVEVMKVEKGEVLVFECNECGALARLPEPAKDR